jgi:hypothetical protein
MRFRRPHMRVDSAVLPDVENGVRQRCEPAVGIPLRRVLTPGLLEVVAA